MVPLQVPGHHTELLAAHFDASPWAERLDEAQRAALVAVLTAPIAFSFVEPCNKSDQSDAEKAFRRLKVPPAAARRWLTGLLAEHEASVITGLEASGILASWHLHSGMCVTLTPLAAYALGVGLTELDLCDPALVRWGIVRPRRKNRINRYVFSSKDQLLLNVIDGAAQPLDQLIEKDETGRQCKVAFVDPWNDKPLLLCGVPVFVDEKLRGAPARKLGRPPGKARKAGKKAKRTA